MTAHVGVEDKVKQVRWFHFWNPESGFIGGLIAAQVLLLPWRLLKWLGVL